MKTFIESQLNSLCNRCIRQLKTKISSKILTRELRLCFDHSQILKSHLWKVGRWNYSSKGYSCINIRHIFSVKWKIIYIKVIIRDWHCLKSVHIRGFLVHVFPYLDWNTERYSVSWYSVQMRKNADQKNSEYG